MLDVMMPELIRAVKDFYNLTGIKTVLYDADRKFLYSYPEKMCEFCAEIRKCPSLTEKCFECDSQGFDVCEKTMKPHVYKCHMGLSEIITPISENGVIIGYMMMGQIICEGDLDTVCRAVNSLPSESVPNRSVLLGFLDQKKQISREFIDSAIGVMSMCVCYLYTNNIIMKRDGGIGERLRKYIDHHLDGDLSVENLCKMLYISKSKLYSISKNEFKMGISDYVKELRIKKAKKMLLNGDLRVSDIAAKVGYTDANYFTRAFKSETGMTPKKYREQKNS